jgi:hypothetical protein
MAARTIREALDEPGDSAMAEPDGTRRFDEREFALILRRAATLQQSDAARPPGSGLSLAEIESIAAEAGIDPVYVRQAVTVVSHDAPAGHRVIGAPARFQHERVLPAELDREAIAAAIEIARTEFGRPGATREAFDGVEWIARDDYGSAWLAIRAHGGAPRVIVGADRTNAAWVLGILLPLGGLIAASVVAGAAGLDPGPVVPAVGAAGGLLGARSLWRRSVARWQARARRVLERVAGTAATPVPPQD